MAKKKGAFKKITGSLQFLILKLWSMLKQFRKYFIIGLVLLAFIEVINLVRTYVFKEIIDNFIYTDKDLLLRRLAILIVIMGFVYLIQSINNFSVNYLLAKTDIKISNFFTALVLKKNLDLSLHYHEKENTGTKLNKLQKGVELINYFFENLFWNVFPAAMKFVFSFVFLLFIDYRLAFVFFIIVPIFLIITFRANYKVDPLRVKMRKKEEKVYGEIGQAIYNIKTVKAFTREDHEKQKGEKSLRNIFLMYKKFFRVIFSLNFLRMNLIGLGNILIFAVGGYLTFLGEITPGEFVLFFQVGVQTYFSLFELTRTLDHIMNAKVGIDRLLKVIDSDDYIVSHEDGIKRNLQGDVEFKNVSFDYGDGKVLKNINFKIKHGEVVALVGPSGGGKSTVAKLLYRYYDVTSGVILIDDDPIENFDIKNYRSQLGIVNQDIDIFSDTVKANISYGRTKATMKEVHQAAKIANADEFVNKLKKKYDTLVGERGIKLSGGQKQRIGIARAILVDPKILILDEATSSLDSSSEKMIQEAIHRVIKNRTTIVIAHRLSTVKNADKIIVIAKGRISQQGTHSQLMRKGGLYKKFVTLQTSGYLN